MKKYLIPCAALTMLLASCEKKFLDVNENPNTATSTTASLVFTNAQNVTVPALNINEIGGLWSGHFSQSTDFIPQSAATFQITNSTFNYTELLYDNAFDYEYVIKNAAKDGVPALASYAKVLKAKLMQDAVDLVGNTPYSEAFKGLDNLAPKYDKAEDIYLALNNLYKEASAEIKALPANTTINADIFRVGTTLVEPNVNGNPAAWLRLANTLRLRLLMRQARVTGKDAYIQAEIQDIAANGGGFLNAGQTITSNPGYQNSSGKLNQFYARYGYNESGSAGTSASLIRSSKFIIDFLKANVDTFRLKRLCAAPAGSIGFVLDQPNLASRYVSILQGDRSTSGTSALTSAIGPAFIQKGVFNLGVVFISAAESYFLRAEAAQRFPALASVLGTAQSNYESGVKEHFAFLGLPVANANTLLAGPGSFTAATDKLKLIGGQKWVALANTNGLEAWCEVRKTNYPVVPVSLSPSSGTPTNPVRLFYAQSEFSANSANVLAQGTVNLFTSRLFWDVD